MAGYLAGSIQYLFYFFSFFVPIVLFPKSSEVFEFNKIVLTYVLTSVVVTAWIIKMVYEKKIYFRRTILDIPLLLFLGSQLLSTFISIDTRTSIFGVYSRFNGGLLSLVSYAVLYWAYVSNMDRQKTLKTIRFTLYAAALVCTYGVLEHFGIDKGIWVQDVQNRVFSTLGQPNWLAAWIGALLPITWASSISNSQFPIFNFKKGSFWLGISLSTLFFLTLLYTKSRSGFLGMVIADFVFWIGFYLSSHTQRPGHQRNVFKSFIIYHLSFIILALAIGTPWSPSLGKLFSHQQPTANNLPAQAGQPPSIGPALETGGTESGQIRKIVWSGAIDIWRHYPVLGTGPETFAFSYYLFRPVAHNVTSEWDYLYNKAHNEYLNMAANTGTVGLASYLFLIAVMGFIFVKNSRFSILNSKLNYDSKINKLNNSSLALASGWVSILVTNFFGFSVVPINILFFLYPAFAITLDRESKRVEEYKSKKLEISQILAILCSCSLALILLYSISKYWYADFLYAKGKIENDTGEYSSANRDLSRAVKLSSNEAIFWDELSQTTTAIVVALNEQQDAGAAELATKAISESYTAVNLSPANVNLRRSQASSLIKLSAINPNYLLTAKEVLEGATTLAPSDAKLFYNLGLAYLRIGDVENSVETLKKTVQMKPNYENARYALALIYIDQGQTVDAKNQLEYILDSINPGNQDAKKELDELGE